MVKAVIYARYSSHAQREESIEGQLRECKSFAEKNDFVIVGEYIDRAISGKTDNRADFQRMIKDSDKGNFEAVIVYAIDRFARNRYDSANYKMKLKKNGVKVYYAKQYIPDTPEGIILESVMEGYAEYYSENLSIQVRRGMRENALQGKSVGGHTPLGYTINKEGYYEIVPSEAKIVQEIFEQYANGLSACKVVQYCNDCGYRTGRNAKFSRNSIRSILLNEKYIGIYRHDDIILENAVPAIVSKELFDRVQSRYKHNFASRARAKANQDYLLSGKLFCGHCKSLMIGECGRSKSGAMYYYYKCADRKKGKKCDKKSERKDWIEEFIVRTTVQTVLTDDSIESIADKVIELLEQEMKDNSVLESLNASLNDVKKRLKNLLDLMEQGIVTNSTKERLMELESQQADLETRIAKETVKQPCLTKDKIVLWLKSFRNGDIKNQEYCRKVVDTLINSVYVYDCPNGDKDFLLTFNISGQNTARVKCSDIESKGVPNCANPNTLFFLDNSFGFAVHVKSTDL